MANPALHLRPFGPPAAIHADWRPRRAQVRVVTLLRQTKMSTLAYSASARFRLEPEDGICDGAGLLHFSAELRLHRSLGCQRSRTRPIRGAPSARDDGWAISNDDEPIDSSALCKMGDQLAASSNVHSVVIARSGKLVFERYFSGSDEVPDPVFGSQVKNVTCSADTLHNVKSAGSQFASFRNAISLSP